MLGGWGGERGDGKGRGRREREWEGRTLLPRFWLNLLLESSLPLLFVSWRKRGDRGGKTFPRKKKSLILRPAPKSDCFTNNCLIQISKEAGKVGNLFGERRERVSIVAKWRAGGGGEEMGREMGPSEPVWKTFGGLYRVSEEERGGETFSRAKILQSCAVLCV